MPEVDKQLSLGSPEVRQLGKCAGGTCLGVYVEVAARQRIIDVHKSRGSDFVHPCSETQTCGHKNEWRFVGLDEHRAEWLGWTDSGDPNQAFTLTIKFLA